MHGTEQQWQPPAPSGSDKESPEHSHKSHPSGHTCPRCGNICGGADNFCPVCGYDFIAASRNSSAGEPHSFDPFGNVSFPSFDPLGGVDRSTQIDGHPAEEVAAMVSVNSARYCPKFASMKKTGKRVASWNWAAFLLSGYWFFYRKCYLAGTITMALSLAASLLLYPFENLALSIVPTEYATSYTSIFEYIFSHLDKIPQSFLILAGTAIVITLLKSIVCGLLGDYIYKRRCITAIAEIKSSESEDYRADINRKGGVNLFAPIVVYMIVGFIQTMLIYML